MSESYQELVGTRVVVTPSGLVGFLRGRRGVEWVIQPENTLGKLLYVVGDVEPCLLVCAGCGEGVSRTFKGGLCATCYRGEARTRQAQAASQLGQCDRCMKPGALRNPLASYTGVLCPSCWQDTGEPLRLREAETQAECAGNEVSDPRHDWHQVRRSRWHCKGCGTKWFGADPRE